ncbi:MAG: hypothetical protein NUW22_04970 [Acidobacteria bacterium]|nr:hypothetical protein [Acidobacteriota bacterium]
MRKLIAVFACVVVTLACDVQNKTALQEQAATEANQAGLLATQPPPSLSWSMERDNLIKRFKLMNDRAVVFYMYVFIEGVADPVGYYMVNKVSSVDSQLTNPMQIVQAYSGGERNVLPSPAEDGSYGTNGTGVFGFTPEDAYVEHNLKYITSTIPLTFAKPVQRLAIVTSEEAQAMLKTSKAAMAK